MLVSSMNIIGSVKVFFLGGRPLITQWKLRFLELTLGVLHALLFLNLRKNF